MYSHTSKSSDQRRSTYLLGMQASPQKPGGSDAYLQNSPRSYAARAALVSKSAVASFRIGWAGMWFARMSWPYLIYLYPVFSHFPEEMHLALLREFHRLLRPGGLLIAPTRQRNFILWQRGERERHHRNCRHRSALHRRLPAKRWCRSGRSYQYERQERLTDGST